MKADTVILVYPGAAPLDIFGPAQALAAIGNVTYAARTLGPIMLEGGVPLVPTATFGAIDQADLILVPGGEGEIACDADSPEVAFLKRLGAGPKPVASICTGALILARAGLLDGRKATTNWLARAELARMGVSVSDERILQDGHVITAAGPGTAIELGIYLTRLLKGDFVASLMELGLEYRPESLMGTGDPALADAAMKAALAARFRYAQ